MAENIRKLCNILFYPVKNAGEQMAQIVRKYLSRIDVRLTAQRFHIAPNIRTTDRSAAAGDEYAPPGYPVLRQISEQFLLQIPDDKNRTCFPFARNRRFTAFYRVNGNKPEFADTDTGPADPG